MAAKKIAGIILVVLIGLVVISAIPSILESNYYASVNRQTEQMSNPVLLSNGQICDSKNIVGFGASGHCKGGGFKP